MAFEPDRVVVTVALRRRRLQCPRCSYLTWHREHDQQHDSVWRHLDLGVWRLEVRCRLRRVRCPEHGVLVEAVPFARDGARFTRDFEDLVAWLATKTDKTTVCRLVRIDWATVGRIIERVAGEQVDGDRLRDLFEISIDEVAWRKGHRYLTLVGDHRTGKVVWGSDGKGQAAAGAFFDELDPPPEPPHASRTWEPVPAISVPFGAGPAVDAGEGIHAAWLNDGTELDPCLFARASRLTAVSMDMTGGYAKAVRERAPQATIVIDNYHVVALATKALDEVRRQHWNELRAAGDSATARQFKHDRWALLRNPADLSDQQAATLAQIQAGGGKVARAWAMKEMVRAIFAKSLTVEAVSVLLDRLLARFSRCRLQPFLRLGRTIRKHRDGILAARRLKLSNARAEALNNRVKLIVRPRLWVPLRPSRARARSPHLRPDHPDTPTRTTVRVISPTIMPGEPFLFSLTARGLQGVRLCVSDAHQGLRAAIARVLGCRWQRCTVHYADLRIMPTGVRMPNWWPASRAGWVGIIQAGMSASTTCRG